MLKLAIPEGKQKLVEHAYEAKNNFVFVQKIFIRNKLLNVMKDQ